MVWLAMLSAALAAREKAHIGMEALISFSTRPFAWGALTAQATGRKPWCPA